MTKASDSTRARVRNDSEHSIRRIDSPYMTVVETAAFLRTTPAAIYARIARNQLPGIVRDGARVLVKRAVLERALDETASATPGK